MDGQPYFINVDLAKVYDGPGKDHLQAVLERGDTVHLDPASDYGDGWVRVTYRGYEERKRSTAPKLVQGYIVPPRRGPAVEQVVRPRSEYDILKLSFVDVQQGDATVIEVPDGEKEQVILVDGGENQLFARFLAARYFGTSAENPKPIDYLVVTHGDSDHLIGFTEILKSETYSRPKDPQEEWLWKRLFIAPRCVYHNGLVKHEIPKKGPDHPRPEAEAFGTAVEAGEQLVITELHDDLREVPDSEMNDDFRRWKRTLETYGRRGPLECHRLRRGLIGAFDLRNPAVSVDVLGPIPFAEGGVEGLPFLGEPSEQYGVGHSRENEENRGFTGISASHTINGHSIVLRLRYGKFALLLGADLNEQAQEYLVARDGKGLRAEVFKVPHHGSRDFLPEFLKLVAPLVSVVSSGDEKASKDYIHPRATLMNALGRYARNDDSVVFVTEMVAFFAAEGYVTPEQHLSVGGVLQSLPAAQQRPEFYAFSRKAFGLVKVRTNGTRILVCTDSAQLRMKETYAFEYDEANGWQAAAVVQA